MASDTPEAKAHRERQQKGSAGKAGKFVHVSKAGHPPPDKLGVKPEKNPNPGISKHFHREHKHGLVEMAKPHQEDGKERPSTHRTRKLTNS